MRFHLLALVILLLPVIDAPAQTPPVPPRNVADILAVLDQYKQEPTAVETTRAQANQAVPEGISGQKLAVYYHRRGRANKLLGNAKQQIADFGMALANVFGNAFPEEEGIGDRNRILMDLAEAEFAAGNWLRSIAFARELATDTRGSGFVGNYFITQNLATLGDLERARIALRELDQIYSRLGSNLVYEAMRERAHGMVLDAQGNFGEAERRHRKSIESNERAYEQSQGSLISSRYARAQSTALMSWSVSESLLARNLRNQGRAAEAEYYARNALLRVLRTYGRYSSYTASSVYKFGQVVMESGRFREAEAIGRSAIESFERSGSVPEALHLARARGVLGEALVAQGRWSEALSVFAERDKALALDPAQYAIINGDDFSWAIALLQTGENTSARAMVERLYRKRLSSGLTNSEYFTAQARGFYAMALAADGQVEKALAEFRGAIPVLIDDARRTGGDEGGSVARQMRLVWILESYMKLLLDLRDSPILNAAGIDATTESFRIADVARGSKVQRALAESAARATPSDPALAELARREQDAQQRFGTLSDLLNRLLAAPPEQQLTKVIADLRRDIDALRVDRDKLKAELEKRFPDYAELIAPKPTTLGQAQAALAPGEALISIYVGTDRSYVWAVPKTGSASFAEVRLTEKEVAAQVAHLRKALDVGEFDMNAMPPFDLVRAHELYRSLLQPVEAGWREAKTLVVVPHKALGELPFAVLTTAAPLTLPVGSARGAIDYRQVPWLIRRAAIAQLPSVSTLLALRRMPADKPGRKEFIGFGDPLFSKEMALASNEAISRRRLRNLAIGSVASRPVGLVQDAPVAVPTVTVNNSAGLAQLSRLPDTAEEISSIAKVLRADPANDIFLGSAASEKNVKSGQLDNRRIVMFATHGLVPGDLDGLTQPALALSAPEVTGNAGEDGLLTMEEVLGLKLHADWVVLSACNTASGSGAGSEAVSGLGKAFFFAGARTLLVSNWPVETVSAKLLTTRLFEYQTENPGSSRAEALRATMLDLMDRPAPPLAGGEPGLSYAHPLFWAPFSLVGDGGR